MKISLNWIKEYTSIELTPEELEFRLSGSLTEVENIERFDERYRGIVAAKVTEVEDHPESDKLLILKLDIGDSSPRQVVVQQCPVKKSDVVPYLKAGIVIPETFELGKDAVKVKETEIAGIKSDGMVPSGREMVLNNDHTTVYTLPENVEPGTPVDQALDLVDHILEIKNKALTHRPDTFSTLGIAREIHAIQEDSEFAPPKWLKDSEALKPDPDKIVEKYDLEIINEVESLCHRYFAVVIDGVEVKPSPQWLQIRLSKMGVRPVNNIVDISNYLMLEVGQPNHCFDYDKVVERDPNFDEKALIKVRLANSNESIVTLDGQNKDLYDDTIVISDSESPIGIAGVMGGKDTEISDETKTVIFQVENLDMYSIRRTSMKTGLFTDAVTRFSKGLDPNLCEPVLYKGIQMFEEIAGGHVASKLIDHYPRPVKPHSLTVNMNWLRKRIGVGKGKDGLSDERIKEILTRLDLGVKNETEGGDLVIEIPTFRKDLQIREDILEEVVRIYGYHKVDPSLPLRDLSPVRKNSSRAKRLDIKQALKNIGANEMYTYSFVGRELYEKMDLPLEQVHKLQNPLSPDLEYMRPILGPSLLEKLPQNLELKEEIAAFEIDMVNPGKGEDSNELPQEPWHLSLVHTISYYHAKLYLDTLMKALNVSDYRLVPYDQLEQSKLPEWIQYANDMCHPTRIGYIQIKDTYVGLIGQVDSDSVKDLSIPKETSLFEIRVDDLEKFMKPLPEYREPSKFPSVVQDFCFELDKDVPYRALYTAVDSIDENGRLIKDIECIDIYKDDSDAENKRITVRVTFQSDKKTLADTDIESARELVISSVNDMTGGVLLSR